ncbi:MAG: amidohydrolase family protein, partial [Pseudomonadota bacterium]
LNRAEQLSLRGQLAERVNQLKRQIDGYRAQISSLEQQQALIVPELEMLREAGFSALEVMRAATLIGAKILGVADETGSIQVGKRADMIIVSQNPLANLKTLYATGHIKLNGENKAVRTGGVETIIRDGVIFDGYKLRTEIKADVAAAKAKAGIADGPMPLIEPN